MTALWYAMHSQVRKEVMLRDQVLEHGFECFCPQIRVHPVNPRAHKVQPYFPGYLFVRADLALVGLSVFQWMRFGTGLVSFGGEPAVVPDSLIHEIGKRVGEINASGGEVFAQVKPGDKVYIHSGPFSGYEAIFDARLPGSERVRVLLRLLNQPRIVPVELNVGSILLAKKAGALPTGGL